MSSGTKNLCNLPTNRIEVERAVEAALLLPVRTWDEITEFVYHVSPFAAAEALPMAKQTEPRTYSTQFSTFTQIAPMRQFEQVSGVGTSFVGAGPISETDALPRSEHTYGTAPRLTLSAHTWSGPSMSGLTIVGKSKNINVRHEPLSARVMGPAATAVGVMPMLEQSVTGIHTRIFSKAHVERSHTGAMGSLELEKFMSAFRSGVGSCPGARSIKAASTLSGDTSVRFSLDMYETMLLIDERILKACGGIAIRGTVCHVWDRPKHIKVSDRGLHCDLDAAVKYADKNGLYYLNGVEMPSRLVLTPVEKLNVKFLFEMRNAEQRREVFRKLGVDRVCDEVQHKRLDHKGDYTLLEFVIESIRGTWRGGHPRGIRMLKMKNPSTGDWHLEGVPRSVGSVRAALEWRNQAPGSPEVLT